MFSHRWQAGSDMLKTFVNENVYMEKGVSVQLRLPRQTVQEIDSDVRKGRFKSRSDAIRYILQWFEEREKTLRLIRNLEKASAEAKKHPEKWARLEDL